MFIQAILYSYRAIALLITSIPMIINVVFIGDIVTSLIYVPLISIFIATLSIYLDKKLSLALQDFCQQIKRDKDLAVQPKILARYFNKARIGFNCC
jgi:phosphate/sulfate permease